MPSTKRPIAMRRPNEDIPAIKPFVRSFQVWEDNDKLVGSVEHVRACVDSSEPQRFPHLSDKTRGLKAKRERENEIALENQSLGRRLQFVNRPRRQVLQMRPLVPGVALDRGFQPVLDNWEDWRRAPCLRRDLLSRQRRQALAAAEDHKFLERVGTVRGVYSAARWRQEGAQQEHFAAQISKHRVRPATAPAPYRVPPPPEGDLSLLESTYAVTGRHPSMARPRSHASNRLYKPIMPPSAAAPSPQSPPAGSAAATPTTPSRPPPSPRGGNKTAPSRGPPGGAAAPKGPVPRLHLGPVADGKGERSMSHDLGPNPARATNLPQNAAELQAFKAAWQPGRRPLGVSGNASAGAVNGSSPEGSPSGGSGRAGTAPSSKEEEGSAPAQAAGAPKRAYPPAAHRQSRIFSFNKKSAPTPPPAPLPAPPSPKPETAAVKGPDSQPAAQAPAQGSEAPPPSAAAKPLPTTPSAADPAAAAVPAAPTSSHDASPGHAPASAPPRDGRVSRSSVRVVDPAPAAAASEPHGATPATHPITTEQGPPKGASNRSAAAATSTGKSPQGEQAARKPSGQAHPPATAVRPPSARRASRVSVEGGYPPQDKDGGPAPGKATEAAPKPSSAHKETAQAKAPGEAAGGDDVRVRELMVSVQATAVPVPPSGPQGGPGAGAKPGEVGAGVPQAAPATASPSEPGSGPGAAAEQPPTEAAE